MERAETVDGRGCGQARGAGGAERGQCPPVVGHELGLPRACHAGEDDKGQVAGETGVRLVPAGQYDCVRIDALEVDDVLGEFGGQLAVGAASAEHQGPCPGVGDPGGMVGVDDDLGHRAQPQQFRQILGRRE